MEVGTPLKIQLKGATIRYTSELVGIDEGNFLILKLPPLTILGESASLFFRGNDIIVRYMHKGTISGFQSRIIYVIFSPLKLLFIEFPMKFENLEIRTNKRISCYLPANIKISDEVIEGCITDISKEGCQFIVETTKLANNISNLQIDNIISLGFQLPGVEKELVVTAIQKNIKKEVKNVNLGLVFTEMDDDAKTKFNDFFSRAINEPINKLR